ncbi:F0F1-type ATP synthase membrane subunit c/vacuolar-type H+-ATPase subunit K [Catenuloplanes nepalensis]|uniref:F0F1-type ATP synthase membrane subunit c/vacuolar-type H+-ATPase subunit K n=1 Tax=Catenuloplanes nepalensis TaxID=587533 RepID=A0ABT9MQP0_9ACTN|nr:hypothetical protein [Catenuloplanes nepalensis]MDP9793739.1 F0F1-type ATP synthase membrane subunit c/vacuolar-type H+-ATPase subunit K [Catenuloplanes nepalensis]
MANELWVGVITGATALGASLIAALGASRAALAQARAGNVSQALAQQRERRRAAYREMMASVHAFMTACWEFPDVDELPGRRARQQRLTRIHERMGRPASEVTRATREVMLDGPADVSAAAEEVRLAVLHTQGRLRSLIDRDDPAARQAYEGAYQDLRHRHEVFINLARSALEVRTKD